MPRNIQQVSSAPGGDGRAIYLPLESLNKCTYCAKTAQDAKLSWCTSCAEALYCSSDCQKTDWKTHKLKCGTTDRIDLQTYYPFLACIVAVSHFHPMLSHPALTHQIINSPNPNSGEIVAFPNGDKAKMILLGKPVPQLSIGSTEWWPTGTTAKIRHKLMRRIVNEGLVLPINLAVCIALLSEMYTTTSSKSTPGKRRVRLSYHRSPITDFGIVHGSAPVTPQDRLAYYNIDTHTFMMGQDPNDHYWMYFTTLSGEEHFLDCNMFTFNFCILAKSDFYANANNGMPELSVVPAFFFDRDYAKRMPLLGQLIWKPKKRVSILREASLKDLVGASANFDYHDLRSVYDLMKDISGRECTDWEKEMMREFLPNACKLLRMNMHSRAYLGFPKEPNIMIETDPGEDVKTDEHDEELDKYLKKWGRRLKKGKISPEQWQKAFNSWRDKPLGAKLEMGGGATRR